MEVSIAGRHLEITDAMRDHVQHGMEKLGRHFDRAIDADVILTIEKHRQIAEINVHANGLRVNAKESSVDLYQSFDAALSKVDRQVTRYKERIMRHKPRTAREERSFEHHVIGFGAPGEPPAEQTSATDHHVIHRETLNMKPMSVEEAALQLDLTDEKFFVFTNAETERVNVIYPRGDGTYGLIEPPS